MLFMDGGVQATGQRIFLKDIAFDHRRRNGENKADHGQDDGERCANQCEISVGPPRTRSQLSMSADSSPPVPSDVIVSQLDHLSRKNGCTLCYVLKSRKRLRLRTLCLDKETAYDTGDGDVAT